MSSLADDFSRSTRLDGNVAAVRLASADVHANGAGVVVLEIVQGIATRAAHLVGHGLSSGARTGGNGVGVARGNAHASEVALLAGHVGPSSRLASGAAQLREAA